MTSTTVSGLRMPLYEWMHAMAMVQRGLASSSSTDRLHDVRRQALFQWFALYRAGQFVDAFTHAAPHPGSPLTLPPTEQSEQALQDCAIAAHRATAPESSRDAFCAQMIGAIRSWGAGTQAPTQIVTFTIALQSELHRRSAVADARATIQGADASSEQTPPTLEQQRRAFEIADTAMIELLRSHSVGEIGAEDRFWLCDDAANEVDTLGEACGAIRDAYEWLAPRNLVALRRAEGREYIELTSTNPEHQL